MDHHHLLLPTNYHVRDPNGHRYVVQGLLGQGGFSAVYLVKDKDNPQQLYALKEVINPDKGARERLDFEWETLKRLNHPSLPRVYRVFEHQPLKRVFILMEYINGPNLEFLRRSQPEKCFSLPLSLALIDPIVRAVSYLHRQHPSIIHRDIKPSNIVVPLGLDAAVLVDFSIAKAYIPDLTTTTARHGTKGYAAPEQYSSGTNPRTDIYGLGATIYTLLTGTIPADAIVRLTQDKDPLKPPHVLMPAIPPAISAAVLRAMHLKSEQRYASVEDFWRDIHASANATQASPSDVRSLSTLDHPAIQVHRIESMSISTIPRRPRIFHNKIPALVAILLLLLLIPGAIFFLQDSGRSLLRTDNSSPTAAITPTIAITPAPTPTLTPTPRVSSLYPLMAQSYGGTITNMQNRQKDQMQLSNIVQKDGQIKGDFVGYGLSGPFEGKIFRDKDKKWAIQFSADVGSTMVFDGHLQSGGTIAGSFHMVNGNGESTGEEGLWSIYPV